MPAKINTIGNSLIDEETANLVILLCQGGMNPYEAVAEVQRIRDAIIGETLRVTALLAQNTFLTTNAASHRSLPEYKKGDQVMYDDDLGSVVEPVYSEKRGAWDYQVKFDGGGMGTVWGSDLVRADTPLEG